MPELDRIGPIIEDFASVVRVAGSREERLAAFDIARRFEEIGYEDVAVKPFGIRASGGTSRNVVCRKPGSDPAVVLVVGAHYDSRAPASPGAIDNASGIAVLLEAARCLRDEAFPFDVVYVAFGAEERVGRRPQDHHFGSRFFSHEMATGKSRVIGMINVDMACGEKLHIGSMGLAAPWLRDVAHKEATSLGLQFVNQKERGESDHEAFERRGIPVVYIHWWPAPAGTYHTPADRPDKVAPNQVAQTAELVIATIKAAAGRYRPK